MKLCNALVLGTVAAGSLIVALPAAASQRHEERAVVVAKRDYGDYGRGSQDERADERRRAEGRQSQSLRRESGDSNRYGYGYERRQRNAEGGERADDERRRNRREEGREERREERRDERRNNDGRR